MITEEDVLSFFSGSAGRPVKRRELARALGVAEHDYPDFRNLVRDLIKNGRLVRLKRGRLAPPDPLNLVVGTARLRGPGNAFITVDDRPELSKIFVRANRIGTTLDGDRVMVRLLQQSSGPSPEGEVIRIVNRAGKPLMGTFARTKYFAHVRPNSPSPIKEIYIPLEKTQNAQPGQQVLAAIDDWPAPDLTPQGRVLKVLGFPGDEGLDIQQIIHEFNLPGNFPKAVQAEVRALKDEITAEDLVGRSDFRDTLCFTIDPDDAKDYDDAVSIEEITGGWRIGVHIADVAHFIQLGTALEQEAYERGTSVYLVDRVLPMLPPRLSNNLCSLKAGVDRLTMSCLVEVNSAGEIGNFELVNSVIRSRSRLTYQRVFDFFASGRRGQIPAEVAASLTVMRRAAQALRRERFKQGSLDLDIPEVKVILDRAGVPQRLELVGSDEAHQLIEDLMLLANRCLATFFMRNNAPLLFRVHAPPDREKIEEFASFVSELGVPFSVKGGITTKKLARFLTRLADDPRREVITRLLLRSLMKAEYKPENVGHFGLGFNQYCHFTSPIRRYPDLWVHRHLKKILARDWNATAKKKTVAALPVIGRWSSDRERIALEAERDSVRIKQLQYLANHLGDEYQGSIAGFLDFGFFVTLDEVWADGLVRFSGIDDDYYHYDPARHRVDGRRHKRTFRLGDRVRVRVIKVDQRKREIDLIMADAPLEEKTKRRWGRRHGS